MRNLGSTLASTRIDRPLSRRTCLGPAVAGVAALGALAACGDDEEFDDADLEPDEVENERDEDERDEDERERDEDERDEDERDEDERDEA